MVDARSPFSGYLDSIYILRSKYSDGPAVWEFIGQNYDQAFNVPPGADVVVRNLDYFLSPKELPVVFFHNLTLDFDRHVDWDNGKGALPVHGEYDMHWLDDESRHKERLYPLDGKERVSLDTWCVQTLPITYRED